MHSSAQQARQVLADRLRELRVDAGLTGREHALRCEWSIAKTSRIENNKTAPSATDIRTWCHACAADDQADDLITSLRTVEGMFIEWRRILRNGLRHAPTATLPLFQRTKHFRSYASWFIPGILQTPEYASQILRATQQREHIAVDDVAETLAVRDERHQLLTNGNRVFGFLIEEPVLRTGVFDNATMAEQLHKLTEYAALPNVSLGILPTRLARHEPVESFWIFDNTQVNVELVSGYLTVTQAREIATYARTFAELARHAATGTEARKLITTAIDALR